MNFPESNNMERVNLLEWMGNSAGDHDGRAVFEGLSFFWVLAVLRLCCNLYLAFLYLAFLYF
jgi:hypothetical protein